jgi:uncharacterized protein
MPQPIKPLANKIGSPVEGDDFFERPKDLQRLRSAMQSGSVLLTSPRRLGKTSLALRFRDERRGLGQLAIDVNVEDCYDEVGFFEKLVGALAASGLKLSLLERTSRWFGRFRKQLGVKQLGSDALNISFDDANESLRSNLSGLFKQIEEQEQALLIIIDELPEMLHAIRAQESGVQRVEQLLHWLRAARQSYRQKVSWLFLGSVGLDVFVEHLSLSKTINDLLPVTLEPLSLDEGHRFLAALSLGCQLQFEHAAQRYLLSRLGWIIPHHLQIVFHELVSSGCQAPTTSDLEQALHRIPMQTLHFSSWHQRLDKQFDALFARDAHLILAALCVQEQGLSQAQLLNRLMARPHADPDETTQRLGALLRILARDGYLMRSSDRYAFRSYLLREYWRIETSV